MTNHDYLTLPIPVYENFIILHDHNQTYSLEIALFITLIVIFENIWKEK